MKPRAFVAMPSGTRAGADGTPIDFDRVYAELLEPALEAAGCEVFRADAQPRAGEIRSDMLQELLLADLVLADLTLDDPNLWYALGVRQALRARGVVVVQGPRPTNPFDLWPERRLNYRLAAGVPAQSTLAAERAALAKVAQAALAASPRLRSSPVYALLPQLREPAWRELLLADRNELAAACEDGRGRVELARRKGLPGDILVLADEMPNQALWLEARRDAGLCLLELRRFEFALEQFDAVLRVDPDDPIARGRRIVCLGRLGRHEEAHEAARRLTGERPADPEAWALAGQIGKQRWIARWRSDGATPAALRGAAAAELASLEEAITPYRQAFVADPSHHRSGINALTLQQLRRHLGGEVAQGVLDDLAGGVRWAALSAAQRDPRSRRARASLAELSLLLGPGDSVGREYRVAAAAAQGDWFALDALRRTPDLAHDLGWRPGETAAAREIVQREIDRVAPPWQPRQVLLFSGHMVDAPTRAKPRFPAAKVAAATAEVERALDALKAGPEDLALTQGAAGGDLIFAEACVRRGVRLQLLLPLPEPEFIERSVLPSTDGERWRERYFALKARLALAPREMARELGALAAGADAFERCNLWLLHTALAHGADRVRFVCLWDGGGGDGPGGTKHMVDEVRRRTGHVLRIDPATL